MDLNTDFTKLSNRKETQKLEHPHQNLKLLLHHGAVSAIAKKLGISAAAVSQALKAGKPGNRIVQEAVLMAEASGALYTAQALASLTRI